MLVWICRFSLPFGVLEGLRFVIVALPGYFSITFFLIPSNMFFTKESVYYSTDLVLNFDNLRIGKIYDTIYFNIGRRKKAWTCLYIKSLYSRYAFIAFRENCTFLWRLR